MIPPTIRYLALCIALTACGDKAPKVAQMNEAMPNLPLPPDPSFVERTAGPDALQVTVRSPASTESVAAYYRQVFKQGSWRLVNDAKDVDGATVLLAQRDGPPLWVRILADPSGQGSLVELSGAVVPKRDSAAARPSS